MHTKISGGGGGGAPFATSRANMFILAGTTIANGDTIGIPFNNLTTIPSDTTDYTLVADNGDGTAGLQVNKDGFYLVEYIMDPLTLTGGTITVFLDTPNGFGGLNPGSIILTPAQTSDANGTDALCTYFTAISEGLDAIGVFIRNNSGASITIGSSSIHLFLTRLAPSPSP